MRVQRHTRSLAKILHTLKHSQPLGPEENTIQSDIIHQTYKLIQNKILKFNLSIIYNYEN